MTRKFGNGSKKRALAVALLTVLGNSAVMAAAIEAGGASATVPGSDLNNSGGTTQLILGNVGTQGVEVLTNSAGNPTIALVGDSGNIIASNINADNIIAGNDTGVPGSLTLTNGAAGTIFLNGGTGVITASGQISGIGLDAGGGGIINAGVISGATGVVTTPGGTLNINSGNTNSTTNIGNAAGTEVNIGNQVLGGTVVREIQGAGPGAGSFNVFSNFGAPGNVGGNLQVATGSASMGVINNNLVTNGIQANTISTIISGGNSTATGLVISDAGASFQTASSTLSGVSAGQLTLGGTQGTGTAGRLTINNAAGAGILAVDAGVGGGIFVVNDQINQIIGTDNSRMGGGNAIVDLSNNAAFLGVVAGSTITATNNQILALTSDNRGLVVNSVATGGVSLVGGATTADAGARTAALNISQDGQTVSLLNNVNANGAATTGHGLTIGPTQTILSGGTNSSSWTVQDAAATLGVGTAATPEIQLINATNTGTGLIGSTAVTIGQAGISTNTLQGNVNNLDATGAGSQNNLIAETNNIGTTAANTNNNIGNVNTSTNLISGSTTTIQTSGGNSLRMNNTGLTVVGVTNTITGTTNNLNGPANNIGANVLSVNTIGTAGSTNNLNGITNNIGANQASTNNIGTFAGSKNNIGTADNTSNNIGNYGTSVNTISGQNNTIAASNQSSISGGANFVAANAATGVSANGNGATLAMNGANVSLTNNTGHGLNVTATQTVLSGGTTSTALTLNDAGAHFSNTVTGGPARVTGVADGVNRYDAVNVGQMNTAVTGIYNQIDHTTQKAYSGIAQVAAMQQIPAPIAGKNYSVGIGGGFYAGQQAIAFGAKANVIENVQVGASFATGFGSSSNMAAAVGAGFSW